MLEWFLKGILDRMKQIAHLVKDVYICRVHSGALVPGAELGFDNG